MSEAQPDAPLSVGDAARESASVPSSTTDSSVVPAAAVDSNVFFDACRMFGGLLNNAGYVGVAIGIGLIRLPKTNPSISVWSLVGMIILALVAVFFGCFVVAAVTHVKRIIGAEQAASACNSMPQIHPVPNEPAGDRYWLLFEGRATGPYSSAVLRDAATRGDFSWDTPVCQVGAAQWLPLHTLPSSSPPPIPSGDAKARATPVTAASDQ